MKIKLFLILYTFLFYACDKNPSINNSICNNNQVEFICWDNSIQCSYEDCPNYFNVQINETGESTLFIFRDTIAGLNPGDEIGVFDQNGIINENGNIGSLLVGSGVWNNEQLEIVGVMAQDFSNIGGPILPGAINSNTAIIKIWNKENQYLHEEVLKTVDVGTGTFNALFTAYSELSILE